MDQKNWTRGRDGSLSFSHDLRIRFRTSVLSISSRNLKQQNLVQGTIAAALLLLLLLLLFILSTNFPIICSDGPYISAVSRVVMPAL